MTSWRQGASILVPLALWSAGCGEVDGPSLGADLDFVQFDSAGVLMSRTDGAAARSITFRIVDSVPDLEVGVVSGLDPYQFHQIAGARILSNGTLWVMDGATAELRGFDQGGTFLRNHGGRGEGPGEFTSPRLVQSFSPDTLAVFDFRDRSLTLFNSGGEVLGGSRIPLEAIPFGSPVPVGVLESRMLFFDSGRRLSGTTYNEKAVFQTLNPVDGRTDTIVDWEGRLMVPIVPRAGSGTSGRPFEIRPSGSVGASSIFITRGHEPRVLEFDPEGRLIHVRMLDEATAPATAQDLEALFESRCQDAEEPGCLSDALAWYSEFPPAPAMPVFGLLQADSGGRIWAGIVDPFAVPGTPPESWVVFDSSGTACGTVETPGALRIEEIGADYILGVWADDLGVQSVRRYRLLAPERPGPC